jgi:two-component system response regulator FixJ
VNAEPTVFVVDDDPEVLESVTRLIEVVYPHVESYRSAGEFLAAYDPSRPGCLVLDVAMPGMSGLELHRKLVEEQVSPPVIFITGHGNVQMAVGAMRAGAVDFLEKPFREQDLWESIRRALEIDGDNRRREERRRQLQERMANLSSGEREVLRLILAGKYNKEIAAALNLSVRTVEDRRARLMKKLRVGSVVEMVQLVMDG